MVSTAAGLLVAKAGVAERTDRALFGQLTAHPRALATTSGLLAVLALLRAASGVADGADISSGGELAQARLAGFDPAAMSFAGPAKTEAELEAAIVRALELWSTKGVLVARAAKGVSLGLRGQPVRHFRTVPREVFDASGAGDTALAALGLSIAAGADMATAIAFAAAYLWLVSTSERAAATLPPLVAYAGPLAVLLVAVVVTFALSRLYIPRRDASHLDTLAAIALAYAYQDTAPT